MSLEQGPQLPANAPKTPTTQHVIPQAGLLNSTPLNQGTPTQVGEATNPFVKFVDPLFYDDLEDRQKSTASVTSTDNQVPREYWGLVGRATAVDVFNLTGPPLDEQMVTQIPEPKILKQLEPNVDEEHISALMASQIPAMMNTVLIRDPLHTDLQPHCTETRDPRQLVVTCSLTADELFGVWLQRISCRQGLWRKGLYHRDISPPNIMYDRDEECVVGGLNDWDLSTALSASSTPITDRTGTIPFMALQLLSNQNVAHLFWHDVESFIWVFLWVCGCSDGSGKEVPVAPYRTWKYLDVEVCKTERQSFLSTIRPKDINTSAHHGPNVYFCIFLAELLQKSHTCIWMDIPTDADRDAKDEKDMALLEKVLLPKFKEVRAELNLRLLSGDRFIERSRKLLRWYIVITVALITDKINL